MTLTPVNTQTASRKQFLLVVDSDAGNLHYTSKLLEKFQYKVWTTGNGAEAIEIANTAMPALVVTADRLTDMAGVDLVRKFRRVPVIVLNEKRDPTEQRTCLAAGAATCLGKPVSVEDLYRVVQVAIEPLPRMHVRINTKLPVTIKNKTVNCEDGGCARALSENGVYIKIAHPFPRRTKLPLQIFLNDGPISVDAEVIYTLPTDSRSNQAAGMGMQFVQIANRDRERLRFFIRDQIAEGISIL
jgi:CheY-like chemotaxis protein